MEEVSKYSEPFRFRNPAPASERPADLRASLIEIASNAAREDLVIYQNIRFAEGLPFIGKDHTDPHIRWLNSFHPKGFGLAEVEKYLHGLLNGAKSVSGKPLAKSSVKTLAYGFLKSVKSDLGPLFEHHDGCARVVNKSFAPFRKIKNALKVGEFFSFGEVYKFVHSIGINSRTGLWAQFLFLSSQRISAACSIERHQLNHTRDGVYIEGLMQKGGSYVRPVLPTSLIDTILRIMPGDRYLFTTGHGNIYTRKRVYTLLNEGFQNHLEKSGNLGPHDLRHSFARHMRRTRPELRAGIMLQGGWAGSRASSTFDNTYGLEFLTERDLPSFVSPEEEEFNHERT